MIGTSCAEPAAEHAGQRDSSLLSERLTFWARTRGERTALSFADYSTSRAGVVTPLSYAELDRRVSAAAAVIARTAVAGDRVAVMAPQGLDFVVGFLGALRAAVIAVPLFSPDLPGHAGRLTAVLADCRPVLVLATRANATITRDLIGPDLPLVVLDEIVEDETVLRSVRTPPSGRRPARTAEPDDIAYLQYTSGSTRLPTGVQITHHNIVTNSAQAIASLGGRDDTLVVTWLPLFHDMGLLFGLGGVLVGGFPSLIIDPVAFLMRPVRWLSHLSNLSHGVTAAPNFAYDYAAKRVSEQERAALDLRGVRVMVNGAEPIAPSTLARFSAAFAGCGLAPDVMVPSYGLAEATVYVCGGQRPGGPVTTTFDAGALSNGFATTVLREGTPEQTLVSCGRPFGQQLAIVDAGSGRRLAADRVGEIWVNGPNVGQGYWQDPEASGRVFGQTLLDAADLPTGGWLRTGDLGLLHDDDLYVTGRLKDLMIVDGRNHYPQDVEATVEAAHEVIARHRTAAFSVATNGAGGEGVVVVAELSRHWSDRPYDRTEVRRALRAAVSAQHGLALVDVVLIGPDEIPRTTSGKIARAAGRAQYLAGELRRLDGAA